MEQLMTLIWCVASVFVEMRNEFLYGGLFNMQRGGWITLTVLLVIAAFVTAVWRCRHWELPRKKKIERSHYDREEPGFG